MLDPYKILNVEKTASSEEIKKAYKNLAKKYHPDRNPGNREAEKKFKEVNEAYQMIGSEENRKRFDAGGMDEDFLRGARNGNSYNFSFEDLDSDIFQDIFFGMGGRGGGGFSSIFGNMGKNSFASFGATPERYQIEIPLIDTITGSERELTLPDGRRIMVSIPAGIKDGQTLRIKGDGRRNSRRAEVLLEVKVIPDSRYKIIDNDIEMQVEVPLFTAVLGGGLLIETPQGRIELNVPPNSSSGKKLRIKGKGIGGGKGDLYVVLIISLPPERDLKLESAIRSWKSM